MKYMCGSFQVKYTGELRSYVDLDKYIDPTEPNGLIIGEDASDYVSFHVIEINQNFKDTKYYIGMILDHFCSSPAVCVHHSTQSIAVGINNSVTLIDLCKMQITSSVKFSMPLIELFCNGDTLIAIHEYGATMINLITKKNTEVYCNIVTDVSYTGNEIVLTSLDKKTIRVEL